MRKKKQMREVQLFSTTRIIVVTTKGKVTIAMIKICLHIFFHSNIICHPIYFFYGLLSKILVNVFSMKIMRKVN